MTTENEQTLPKRPRKVRQFFTMEDWQDEVIARKHIRASIDDIRARLKDDGIKTQFRKVRGDDGIQSYAIFYGRPEGNGKKVVYSDNDYLAIHFDPSRKFPGGRRFKKKSDGNEGKKHKAKTGKFTRKMPQERG